MEVLIRTSFGEAPGLSYAPARLAAPHFEGDGELPERVWWVECRGGRNLVRAVGRPDALSLEEKPDRVVWLGEFTLISRPGAVSSRRVEVHGLRAEAALGVEVYRGLAMELVGSLEAASSSAARSVSGRTMAATRMGPVVRRLAPKLTDEPDLLHAVRRLLAADEAVRPGQEDPFKFAAGLVARALGRPWPPESVFAPLSAESVPISDPTDSRIRVEDPDKGTRAHQVLLARLVAACEREGYLVTNNGEVDARVAAGHEQLFFEVKTADDESFVHQIRLAVGQLLDYRHRFSWLANRTLLCVVITEPEQGEGGRARFASAAGVGVVLSRGNRLVGLPDILSQLVRDRVDAH